MLRPRGGKRSPQAAVKIAVDMVNEKLISREESLKRVNADSLNQLFHSRIDPDEKFEIAAKGLNASPGAASGGAVFDPETAQEWAAQGKDVILVRTETTPDDVHGMIAA